MPIEAARNARLSLVLLLLINLFNYLDRYILAAVEPLVRKDLFGDAPDNKEVWLWFTPSAAMGLLATAFLVSYMVMAPIFGWLADRWRRWYIIGFGVIIWSLASGASGFATIFTAMLLTRVFVGIGEAAYGPAAPTLISDLYPVERRGTVLAWFYMAIPVGSAFGYAFGGWMGSHGEKLFNHSGWRMAFFLVVIPGLLLGAWSFLRKEPQRGAADGSAKYEHTGKCPNCGYNFSGLALGNPCPECGKAPGAIKRTAKLSDYRTLLRTPSYVFNCAGMTAMTFAAGGISFWMPRYFYERLRTGDATHDQALVGQVGMTVGGITAVAGLVATLAGGKLADKLRTRVRGSYMLVSGIGMLIGFPLFLGVLFTPFPIAWVFFALAVFFVFLNTGPSNTALANVTHPAIRASAFALNIFVIHALGDAISPPIIGWVADRSSMRTGMAIVAGAIVIAGIFWIIGARHLDRDTELAPSRLPD